MQTLINIVVFILILGIVVLIHELGHFITAKSFGVYCSEFSIGMGPKIFSRKKVRQNMKSELYQLVVLYQWLERLIMILRNLKMFQLSVL